MTDEEKMAWLARICELNEEQTATISSEVHTIVASRGVSLSEGIDYLLMMTFEKVVTDLRAQVKELLALVEEA